MIIMSGAGDKSNWRLFFNCSSLVTGRPVYLSNVLLSLVIRSKFFRCCFYLQFFLSCFVFCFSLFLTCGPDSWLLCFT